MNRPQDYYVRPPFPVRVKPAIADGVFARFDRAIEAELEDSALRDEARQFFLWSLNEFSADDYAEIQGRHLDVARQDPGRVRALKFLNFVYYTRKKMRQAVELGLDTSPPLRILDLGCGPGHFQLIARYFGHAADGLDMPLEQRLTGSHLYDDLCRFFGAPKIAHRIVALQPIPSFPHRFDLVTAFLAAFNGDEGIWGEREWRYFVEDVRANLLAPGGRLHMTITTRKRSDEGMRYLAAAGTWHDDRTVTIGLRDRAAA